MGLAFLARHPVRAAHSISFATISTYPQVLRFSCSILFPQALPLLLLLLFKFSYPLRSNTEKPRQSRGVLPWRDSRFKPMRLQTVAAIKYVFNFVLYHVFNGFASWLEVLPGIKISRMCLQMFTNGSRHGETQVCINIDFADPLFAGLEQHMFWNALCSFEVAAKLIALGNEFGQDCGGAMKN